MHLCPVATGKIPIPSRLLSIDHFTCIPHFHNLSLQFNNYVPTQLQPHNASIVILWNWKNKFLRNENRYFPYFLFSKNMTKNTNFSVAASALHELGFPSAALHCAYMPHYFKSHVEIYMHYEALAIVKMELSLILFCRTKVLITLIYSISS